MNTETTLETPAVRESATATSDRFYLPELDGLRFYAFLAVFLTHALPSTAGPWGETLAPWGCALARAGSYGVDLFFVLSGYLITELLRREHEAKGRLAWKAFYIRRALRIWPLYFVFVLAMQFNPVGLERLDGRHLLLFLLFLGNWGICWWGPITMEDHLWSVSVEEQYYFSWPVLLSVVRRRLWVVLPVAMIAVAVATRIALWDRGATELVFWRNTFSRLDPIAAGCLLALVLEGRVPRWSDRVRWALLAGGAAIVYLLCRVAGRLDFSSTCDAVTRYSVSTAGCVLVFLGAMGIRGGPLETLFRSRPVVYLGRVSYGLYVFHVVAIHAVEHFLPGDPGAVLHWWQPLSLGLTMGLAAASYAVLERPFLRLKEGFSSVRSRPV